MIHHCSFVHNSEKNAWFLQTSVLCSVWVDAMNSRHFFFCMVRCIDRMHPGRSLPVTRDNVITVVEFPRGMRLLILLHHCGAAYRLISEVGSKTLHATRCTRFHEVKPITRFSVPKGATNQQAQVSRNRTTNKCVRGRTCCPARWRKRQQTQHVSHEAPRRAHDNQPRIGQSGPRGEAG